MSTDGPPSLSRDAPLLQWPLSSDAGHKALISSPPAEALRGYVAALSQNPLSSRETKPGGASPETGASTSISGAPMNVFVARPEVATPALEAEEQTKKSKDQTRNSKKTGKGNKVRSRKATRQTPIPEDEAKRNEASSSAPKRKTPRGSA